MQSRPGELSSWIPVSVRVEEWKIVLDDLGEVDYCSPQLPPYSVVIRVDGLRNIKSQGCGGNFAQSSRRASWQ